MARIPEDAQRVVSVPNIKQINLKLTLENAAMWHEILMHIFENPKRANALKYSAIRSCLINCPHFSDAWDTLKERIGKLMAAR